MSRTDLRDHIVNSGLFGDRVYSRIASYKAKYPYCVIDGDSINVTEHMTGVDDAKKYSYSLYLVHDDGEALEQLKTDVIALMETVSGDLIRCFLQSASESFTFDDGRETAIYEQLLSYDIWY
jgi:hypothetical protein